MIHPLHEPIPMNNPLDRVQVRIQGLEDQLPKEHPHHKLKEVWVPPLALVSGASFFLPDGLTRVRVTEVDWYSVGRGFADLHVARLTVQVIHESHWASQRK